jgi:hypothetical protein
VGLWPRVIALAVAAIVAALLLKLAPPVVVLAVFVAVAALMWAWARRSRSSLRADDAGVLGLRREAGDRFGVLGSPLALFARATAPAIDEVLWGRWRSLDVRAFELSLDRPSAVEPEPGRASFACAMTTLQADLPGLVVEPQTFQMQLGAPAPGEAIEVGVPSFDQATTVWSDDRDFALRVLDGPTRSWLLSLEERWGVEVRGRLALVYGPRPERPDVMGLLETLRDLLQRLPGDLGAARPPA